MSTEDENILNMSARLMALLFCKKSDKESYSKDELWERYKLV